MKKVGILTHWDSLHNYGQKLQAYSLEKYIETQNIKPTLIKYRRDGFFGILHYSKGISLKY